MARDKWSDRDFENCFEIRPVTRIRIMWVQSQIWRQWLKIGVLQGSKTTYAFCKIHLTNFAKDESSNHDSENCSEIRLVTRIRKMWVQSQIWRQWLGIGVLQGFKTTSAFCKIRLPNFARDETSNHDYENRSKISAVTWFRICPVLLHFPIFMFFTPPYCACILPGAKVQNLYWTDKVNQISCKHKLGLIRSCPEGGNLRSFDCKLNAS